MQSHESQSTSSTPGSIPSWLVPEPAMLSGHHGMDACLLALLEAMGAVYAEHVSCRVERLPALMEHLENTMEKHFQTEETLQRKARYPAHEIHMAGHMGLMVEWRSLMEQQRTGLCSFGDLYRFMAMSFLKGHIREHDREFHQWLAAHPPGLS